MHHLELGAEEELVYVAEGGANVVFQIIRRDVESFHDQTGDCVLRLRKDLPQGTTRTVQQAYEQFTQSIVPLFPRRSDLLDQILVRISPSQLCRCNNILRQLERNGKRPASRAHVYVATEDEDSNGIWGILMPSMAPSSKSEDYMVEIKPKWLVQSPSAPANARRCRTCALRAFRARAGGLEKFNGFCPLRLVTSGLSNPLEKVVDTITTGATPLPASIKSYLAAFLTDNPLLLHLGDLQQQFQPLLKAPGLPSSLHEHDLALGMTLRDCAMLIKIHARANDAPQIVAKLADLDLKPCSPEKVAHWTGVERELVDGGWYTAADSERGRVVIADDCILF